MSKEYAERLEDAITLRKLALSTHMETDAQRHVLERIAAQLESDAKRFADSQKLQDIGKSAHESIADMVAALECDYDRLEELRSEKAGDTRDWDPDNDEELAELLEAAGDCESREDAEQRIHGDPLSIEIHGEWTLDCVSDGQVNLKDAHKLMAEILLGTGGPAVRLMCELNAGEPTRAWLQTQDWFLPWTDYIGGDSETLLTYARCFYFEEG